MRKIVCLLCMLAFTTPSSASVAPLDKVAAVVNDKIITQSELTKQVKLFHQNLMAQGQHPQDQTALTKQVLEHLILQEIQLQMAERSGIQIDEPMLSQIISNIAKDNHLTLSEFSHKLEEEGIEYELYRQTIRRQLAIQQLQQRDIYQNIQISDQELQQFLNAPNGLGAMSYEYHLGHILIPVSENPSPEELDEAEHNATDVMTKLKEGADFHDLALKTSRGELALKGGDLGWRKQGELPTLFVNIVPSLKQGELANPIKSPSGFHIIKLLDKRQSNDAIIHVTKYQVRHILVQTNDYVSDKEAKTKLNVIKQQIQAGDNFEALAKTHSNDLASSMKGGNLGWVTKDVLVPEFSKVMENMPLTEISEPFQSPFGWHILQVLDKKTVNDSDNALKMRAREMLQQRKFEEKLQAWQNQLRDEAFVKVYL
ncbi:MAG: peptidylprolyl isomerase [Candidatus Berkiella sp.]